MSAATQKHEGPELFFGLVAPLGVGGGTLVWALEQALTSVNYSTAEIHIAGMLRRVRSLDAGEDDAFDAVRNAATEYDRYQSSIRAGDEFCRLLGGINDVDTGDKGQDALVALAIDEIRSHRRELQGDDFTPVPRIAYVFRSLKRPGEVDRLRAVYGSAFILVSAHLARDVRVERFATKLAASDLVFDPDQARDKAEALIKTDEAEAFDQQTSTSGNPGPEHHGQNVRRAFAKADLFVDAAASPAALVVTFRRFIDSLFNYQFNTPSRDEQGMFLAQLASLRSSHLTRQVGAAITTSDGSVVSIGCNEVPKASGGAYWCDDPGDARDFQKKRNTSLEVRREVLGDTLQRLGKQGWLEPGLWEKFKRRPEDVLEMAREKPLLMGARVMDALEYDRSIHAEMLAITDAARRGVPVAGCTLYTTTFPCHNCARHVVAAGVSRVVYIHPYDKSLTKRLHADAVGVDQEESGGAQRVRFDPFVGVSPNLYLSLFSMGKRRGEGKRWMRTAKWDGASAQPRARGDAASYSRNESIALKWLYDQLERTGLDFDPKKGEDDEASGRAQAAPEPAGEGDPDTGVV